MRRPIAMNSPDLKGIRERAEKAAEGPWTVDDSRGRGNNRLRILSKPWVSVATVHAGLQDKATAAFIAHAREDIPALLSRCEVLEGALRGLDEFAWSCVRTDCDESRAYLQSLIDAARSTLQRGGGRP